MVTIMVSKHIFVQGRLLSVQGEMARVALEQGEATGRLLPSLRAAVAGPDLRVVGQDGPSA